MKKYKIKLKLKQSVKDKLMIVSCIILVIIGVVAMTQRIKELEVQDNSSDNDSVVLYATPTK